MVRDNVLIGKSGKKNDMPRMSHRQEPEDDTDDCTPTPTVRHGRTVEHHEDVYVHVSKHFFSCFGMGLLWTGALAAVTGVFGIYLGALASASDACASALGPWTIPSGILVAGAVLVSFVVMANYYVRAFSGSRSNLWEGT